MKVLFNQLKESSLEEIQRYGPNNIASETITQVKKLCMALQEIQQQPVLVGIRTLIPTTDSQRVGLQALLKSFTILMLDEDKSIKRITPENSKQLLDPYILQEKLPTPYVALIPNVVGRNQQPDILLSLSNLYQNLSFLKDLVKLSSGKIQTPFKRLTNIPQSLSYANADSL